MVILILGVVLILLALVLILSLIWQIERIHGLILSVYALLSNENIHEVYNRCGDYLEELNEGSLLMQIKPKGDTD